MTAPKFGWVAASLTYVPILGWLSTTGLFAPSLFSALNARDTLSVGAKFGTNPAALFLSIITAAALSKLSAALSSEDDEFAIFEKSAARIASNMELFNSFWDCAFSTAFSAFLTAMF